MYDLLLSIDFSGPIVALAAAVANRYCNENFKFLRAKTQNFRKIGATLRKTARRKRPAGRFLLFSVLTSAPCAVRRRRS
jgi:hypothetical protein